MIRLLTIVCTIALSSPHVFAQIGFASYAFGKQYWVEVEYETLEKTPVWKDDAEDPPLSARKAISLATEMKNSLPKDSPGHEWVLESAALEPTSNDRWIWLIAFRARHIDPHVLQQGPGVHLRLMVLMDGTVIKPKISDHSFDDLRKKDILGGSEK